MENVFNITNFKKEIFSDIAEIWNVLSELEEHYLNNYSDYKKNEDFLYSENKLKYYLKRLYLKIYFALEYLGLKELLNDFKKGFKEYQSNLLNIQPIPYIGDLDSPALEYLQMYYDAILSCLSNDSHEISIHAQRNFVRSILLNTPKILFDRNIVPEKEKTISENIYNVLSYYFPDTIREISLSRITKKYKPDIGIKSLKTAIEFKFADSKEEVKKQVGELFEDIGGYKGTSDWQFFFAVIYMSNHYFTKEQIISEFNISLNNEKWEILLVVGKGKRKRNSK